MQNGQLTTARVWISAILALTALAGSIWLLHDGIQVPSEYWIIVLAGISGVTGLDLLAWFINKRGGDK